MNYLVVLTPPTSAWTLTLPKMCIRDSTMTAFSLNPVTSLWIFKTYSSSHLITLLTFQCEYSSEPPSNNVVNRHTSGLPGRDRLLINPVPVMFLQRPRGSRIQRRNERDVEPVQGLQQVATPWLCQFHRLSGLHRGSRNVRLTILKRPITPYNPEMFYVDWLIAWKPSFIINATNSIGDRTSVS